MSPHQDSLHCIEGYPFFCGDVVIGDGEKHEVGDWDVQGLANLFDRILGGEGFVLLDGAHGVGGKTAFLCQVFLRYALVLSQVLDGLTYIHGVESL